MKASLYLVFLAALVSLTGCDKNEVEEINNPTVEQYIELLKSDRYDLLDLPEFTYKDIPALLQYRNETQVITNFARNPISSLYGAECALGMYVLWTIESIRAEAIGSEFLIMRFPSQNPVLALRNSEMLAVVSDSLSHSIAAKAYFNWWENSKKLDFDDFKNIDPLQDTAYRWH